MPSGGSAPRSAKTRRPVSDPSAATSNAVSHSGRLGDDQGSVVRRDGHAVGKVQIVGDDTRLAVDRDEDTLPMAGPPGGAVTPNSASLLLT